MKTFHRLTLAICLAASMGLASVATADDSPPAVTPKPGSVQIGVSGPVQTVSLTEILLENYFLLIQAWLI